ncbi:hypothetical protein [Bradyrhizobium tropiciagri]|uniref:hypothetical protein n=1 Tax=Bradyrhizobium tropiciagri TaxID=312253 RepID=UPI000B0CEAFC|nr:hypothetical protein [Bradyrhizobium tropiciagri]
MIAIENQFIKLPKRSLKKPASVSTDKQLPRLLCYLLVRRAVKDLERTTLPASVRL